MFIHSGLMENIPTQKQARRKQGQVGLIRPNNFENNGAKSPTLIRSICFDYLSECFVFQSALFLPRLWYLGYFVSHFSQLCFAFEINVCFAFQSLFLANCFAFQSVSYLSLFHILDKSFCILVNSVLCFVPRFVSCFVPCSALQPTPARMLSFLVSVVSPSTAMTVEC